MDTAVDISIGAMALCYLLLLIPLGIAWYFRVGIIRRMLLSLFRMTVQLGAVGIALIYVFRWDNHWVNIGWILLAIGFATSSAINHSDLNYRKFFLPVFLALFLSAGSVLLFFNGLLLQLTNVFSAQYLIIIGGMLLGNALKGIIIGIADFYKAIANHQNRYRYQLSLGASQTEALIPFFRDALQASLNPTLASMATMGIVFLPGMMAGQIIGGSSPDTAIRYQLAIMIAIFVCITLSVVLTILLSVRRSFDGFGNLKE
jgi:putative ABC transport system permease protein